MNFDIHTPNAAVALELEQLSALVDGELNDAQLDQLMASMADGVNSASVYATWQTYQAIGDAIRSAQAEDTGSADFLNKLNASLAQEAPLSAALQPGVGQVVVPPVRLATTVVVAKDAANQSVFRWKLVAGLASAVAVVASGGSFFALLSGASVSVPQVASVQEPDLVQMPVMVGQNATVMLRDPRLDELLAGRAQMVGAANLQMPASFLRNATFTAAKPDNDCADKSSRPC